MQDAIEHRALDPLFRVKWKFVKRQALLEATAGDYEQFDAAAALSTLEQAMGQPFEETRFAQAVLEWQRSQDDPNHATLLELARRYCAWAVLTPAGQRAHPRSVLFKFPKGLDPQQLLEHVVREQEQHASVIRIRPDQIRRRSGFALTDAGADRAQALDETHYCILCHSQGKDSCSKGLTNSEGGFKRSSQGIALAGCPLEERISEFHTLKRAGLSIAALAMITLDNPLLAATGHRICNDCMKSCIYQKQTPVDIPQAETRTLKDVLALPWGFEIYSLLTRWNPLNLRQPVPVEPTGHKVLVAGMGPAGFTLAHHLLNAGMTVLGIDGLKLEPSWLESLGLDPKAPIFDASQLQEPLDERVQAGFGGVAEYGITVRWNKNFLGLIRLLLERREHFRLIGGVRMGGTLDLQTAWALGFDHVALALGAGKPRMLDIDGGLARGVRAASDFLMALQLSPTARPDGIALLQLRLPVVVVGGGLTAIDTSTEALAYYPVQVERYLLRHEALVSAHGEDFVWNQMSPHDREVAEEFLAHARAIRKEAQAADREGRAARISELVREWGGVRIAYRKRLIDSPAYSLNHEEVQKALEEGIGFGEQLTPVRITTDETGAAQEIVFSTVGGAHLRWPARSVLVAAGTTPNTVLAREFPQEFKLDGEHFQAIDESAHPVSLDRNAKTATPQVVIHRAADGRAVSFFGDLHPSYSGNVVKAMASAKKGAPIVVAQASKAAPVSNESAEGFLKKCAEQLQAKVYAVHRLAPGIVEVVVRAPLAAKAFAPGQFYRLQSFERDAPTPAVHGQATRLATEPLAMTGAWVDRAQGLVSTVVLEMGGSSNLCARFTPGQPVVLMGPTGSPTEIVSGQTVGLVGGGLGNAVLFSIGAALRKAGSRVLYFAGYKAMADRTKLDEIEAAADCVVWCCDEAPGFAPRRTSDATFVGNIIDAVRWWGQSSEREIPTQAVDRWIAIGSDRMMGAFARARHTVLKELLKPEHQAIGSINSPMQCMLKEVCGQCLQLHRDPHTGATRYVFSCFEQDQPLDQVDFTNLHQRLTQNAVLEHQTRLWCRDALGAHDPA
jgi:NADPH-dependent glutamate synthase beta subunit-like oxidoreductase/NAD(P)H-flavin reductase